MQIPVKPKEFITVTKSIRVKNSNYKSIRIAVTKLKKFFKENYNISISNNMIEIDSEYNFDYLVMTSCKINNPNYSSELIKYSNDVIAYEKYLEEEQRAKRVANLAEQAKRDYIKEDRIRRIKARFGEDIPQHLLDKMMKS